MRTSWPICACAIAYAVLSGCVAREPAAVRTPVPARVPVSAALVLDPLDVSPDGEARLLVRLAYRDARGERVHVPPGGHVDVHADRGDVQWQPRARFGDPAAIVRLTEAGPLALRVTSDLPRLPRVMRATTDTRAWGLAPVVARALGPHAVEIGWFPRVHAGAVRIARLEPGRARRELGSIAAPASSFLDPSALPGAHYTYEIRRPDADPIDAGVDMPPALPASTLDAIRGKAMWLSFGDDASRWDADAMAERARAAGIRAIALRLTYGEFSLVTAERRAAVDRLIDAAARRDIAIVGWTVPRAISFEDVAASVAAAAYRTPRGNGVRGLAVDLERGPDFLAASGAGATALAAYARRLRLALGPHVLLVATVEDPVLERLPDGTIPYARIAEWVDVLQPMTYWRMRSAGASIPGMRAELAASYDRLRRLVGSAIPIDIGGQTADLGNRLGAPPPAEVAASVAAAADLGALGEMFFDWDGTSGPQWAALAAARWPAGSAPAAPTIGPAPPVILDDQARRATKGSESRNFRRN